MANLSDTIEDFLLRMLQRSNGRVEIRRSELAEIFNCYPSQINYVLSTRFTFERGYIVESRRGGGGYIRIVRVALPGETNRLRQFLEETLGGEISAQAAANLLKRLEEEKIITRREAEIMGVVLKDRLLGATGRDKKRALLLREMLMALIRAGCG
ncbi:MAG: transcriptional regulator of stress and heat shock response [Eubacteriales bacterium]|nr:transcriptional regulator of stress and heat shock response [Eubacteriales bacterium]MDN5364307.1 transcriptional regulator of stress and heat shock response [Eubacteriales bacterium]